MSDPDYEARAKAYYARHGTDGAYNARHDAYFDPDNDEWLETQCADPECYFCVDRPDRPSQATQQPDDKEHTEHQ